MISEGALDKANNTSFINNPKQLNGNVQLYTLKQANKSKDQTQTVAQAYVTHVFSRSESFSGPL